MKMQKAKHLHLEMEKVTPNIQHDYMITAKIDGWYVYSDYTPFYGWGNIMSSNGRSIPSMENAARLYLDSLANPGIACRLIMEAYIPDTKFHILNGLFNRTVGDYIVQDIHFIAHDLVFAKGYTITALERFNSLTSLGFTSDRLQRAELLGISDNMDVWHRYFDKVVLAGGEGIVLKQANGLYCPGKRNNTLMKIKMNQSVDLLCVDTYKTIGEKGNSNTNITLVNKLGIKATVRVGKHSDIAKIDEDTNYIIGKVCEIKVMEVLETGGYREPTFYCIREDKTKEEID